MTTPTGDDQQLAAAVQALLAGEVERLQALLVEHPALVTARVISTGPAAGSRTLLHVLTDWPGHRPNAAQAVGVLAGAGADVDARFEGAHQETPLHWAASCDDVEVIDALLDAGAEIDAPGAVLGGGSPLHDAVGFLQLDAARRLVERGAAIDLPSAAALGLLDRVRAALQSGVDDRREVDHAFWYACRSGEAACARLLLEHGAQLDWLPFWGDEQTPLDAATEHAATQPGSAETIAWLRGAGARRAAELDDGSRRAAGGPAGPGAAGG